MRNLRILGLAIVAVLAMGAVAASAATAASKLTAPETASKVILTAEAAATGGSQTFQPTVGGGTITCKTIKIGLNTQTVNTESITARPEYGSCKFNNAIATDVDFTTNECEYVFSNGATAGSTTNGTLNLNCKAGSAGVIMIITGTNCVITVPSQDLGTLAIDNTGGPGATRDLTLTGNQTGIHSTETGSECPEPGTHTNGTYVGNVTIKGFIDNAGAEGAQTGILID
jgi:hypothetical protein